MVTTPAANNSEEPDNMKIEEAPENTEEDPEEPIADKDKGGGSLAFMDMIDDTKDELEQEMQDLSSKLQTEFKTQLEQARDKMSAQIKVLGDIAIQDKEEMEQQMDRIKRSITSKLDSVYFDDELDELKQMINLLAETTQENNGNKEQMEKIKNIKQAPKKDRSMQMSNEKK